MIFKKFSRLLAGMTSVAFVASILLSPLAARAVPLTISENGPYVAIDNAVIATTAEWRVETNITPLPNSNGTPANASVVFGYIDQNNYYYANFAAAAGTGLRGIYQVSNGVRTNMAALNSVVSANQSYKLEARHKTGEIKIYLNNVYVNKASGISVAGTKLGAATVNANATVANASLTTTSTAALNLSLVGSSPDPAPTPPTVALTAPANGATVMGAQLVSATAADQQGLSGVQFKLDGANLGAVDTVAPYEISWDTTGAAEGAHTLTAVASNTAGLSTTSAAVNVTVDNQPAPAPTADFTIQESGPNAGIDQAASATGSEWKVITTATAVSSSETGTPANFSVVFGYSDPQNYHYVNFANAASPGVSGVYKVQNGVATKLFSHSNFVTPGQATNIEVRYKSGAVRVYRDSTYLFKVENVSLSGTRAGVAAVDGGAAFTSTKLDTGNATTLSLTPIDLTLTLPPPDPSQALPSPIDPTRTPSTGRQVNVATSAQLQAAIVDAQPGDTITMADGVYASSMTAGNYAASYALTADGTAENPITLIGSPNAIIDGNGTGGRYGLYFYEANYWNLVGFTVSNAAKGIVQDRSSHVFYDDMHVTNIGQEAIHFRAFSSYNTVKNSLISATGRTSEQFGEGVYMGSASGANWGVHTGGAPDTSSHNIVVGTTFTDFKGEAIDIKEGSTSNYIANNFFEGSSLSGQNSADSWIDVKGNYNLFEGNTGTNTLLNGFEVHHTYNSLYPDFGSNNLFRGNTANVNANGYGFYIGFDAQNLGNVIKCDNTVTAAGSGAWNISCTP